MPRHDYLQPYMLPRSWLKHTCDGSYAKGRPLLLPLPCACAACCLCSLRMHGW